MIRLILYPLFNLLCRALGVIQGKCGTLVPQVRVFLSLRLSLEGLGPHNPVFKLLVLPFNFGYLNFKVLALTPIVLLHLMRSLL